MTPATIDQAVFKGLKDAAGAEFVEELVQTFLDEAPVMLAELRQAHTEGAADRFRRAAHSLKSNGNTFGAIRLASFAKDLELGGLPPTATPLDELEAEYWRVATDLAERTHG